MNPMMRLITEGRVRKREERSERNSHFPRDSISLLWKSEVTKGLAQNPMIKPVSKDTTTPAVSFLNPLLIISPFVMATPKVIERIGPIRGDTGGGGHQIRKHKRKTHSTRLTEHRGNHRSGTVSKKTSPSNHRSHGDESQEIKSEMVSIFNDFLEDFRIQNLTR